MMNLMVKRVPGVTLWVVAAGQIAAFMAGAISGTLGYWILLPLTVGLLLLIAASARRRSDATFGPVTDVTPNLILIAVPTILASLAVSFRVSLYATVAVVLAIIWTTLSRTDRIHPAWQSAILPAIGTAILLRPNYPTTPLYIVAFVLGCLAIAGAVYLSKSMSSAMTSLVDGVGLFLFASVALRFLGVGNAAPVDMMNSITGGARVMFPLTSTQSAAPAMATVYLAAVTPILLISRRNIIPRLIAAAAAVDILILADRRGALIGALFVTVSVLLVPRLFRRAAPILVGISLILPFAYGYLQDTFGRILLAAASQTSLLQRRGEGADSASTLNGRDSIWVEVLDFYQNRVDWVHQMFGFGSFGNSASGLSAVFRAQFGDTFGQVTPHNSVLQILFDGGWVLAIVFMVTIFYMAWVLSRRTSATSLAELAMLAALVFDGVTEVALSPSHAQPAWWALAALGMVVFSKQPSSSDQDDTITTGKAGSETLTTATIRPLKQHQYRHTPQHAGLDEGPGTNSSPRSIAFPYTTSRILEPDTPIDRGASHSSEPPRGVL